MTERIAEAPPRSQARITGVVYLLYFLTAMLAEFLLGRGLVAYGNTVNVIAFAIYIAVTVLFYHIFKPVHKSLSLVAALFSIVGCIIGSLSVFHLGPPHFSAFFFFGLYCILIGYLIFTSIFLPRIFGVLMVLAGLGWLLFLSPSLANYLAIVIEALGILAEGLLMLWLLVMGVNEQRWKEQAIRSESIL